MRKTLPVAALLAAVALAACGGPSQPTNRDVGDVSLRVTGGFTGWDRTVVVAKDGTVTYTVARGPSPSPSAPSVQLDQATLARLHDLVSQPAFAGLAPEYSPPPGGADLQQYTITARVGGTTLTTSTWDGASPPQILRDVLAILTAAFAQASV